MRELVLDCSALLAWLFPDEGDPYGMALIEVMRESTAYVPSIWWLEVANAVLVAERKARLTQSDSVELMRIVDSLSIVQDTEQPEDWVHRVMMLGRVYGLSAYDACYLELAIRRGLPVATLDRALMNAAAAAGATVFEP